MLYLKSQSVILGLLLVLSSLAMQGTRNLIGNRPVRLAFIDISVIVSLAFATDSSIALFLLLRAHAVGGAILPSRDRLSLSCLSALA